MFLGKKVSVVLATYRERKTVRRVINEFFETGFVDEVVVVENNAEKGTEEEVKKQIMAIKTDPARIHPTDPGNPDKNITFTYFDLLEYDKNKLESMKELYRKGKIGDVEIKTTFFRFFLEYFADFRTKKTVLLKDKDQIHKLRLGGAQKAIKIAEKVLKDVAEAVGIL